MGRGPKPVNAKVEAKLPFSRKSPKNDARVRDLEKRLAEALTREAEALERETAASEISARLVVAGHDPQLADRFKPVEPGIIKIA